MLLFCCLGWRVTEGNLMGGFRGESCSLEGEIGDFSKKREEF